MGRDGRCKARRWERAGLSLDGSRGGAPSHYNPDRENAPVREDHRPPASVLSLKGVRRQGRSRTQPGGFGLRGASPAPGKTPALLSGPGGAVRRGEPPAQPPEALPPSLRCSGTSDSRQLTCASTPAATLAPAPAAAAAAPRVAGGGGGCGRRPNPGHLFSPSSHFPFGSGRRGTACQ